MAPLFLSLPHFHCLYHCLSLSLSLSLSICPCLSPSESPSPSLPPFLPSPLSLHNPHKVQQASADDLPFEDRSYDRYVANLCLMLVPDFPKSVSEAARVLRPGGMLGATLWGDRAKSPFFTIQPKVRNLCFLRSNPRYQGAKLVFHFFKQKVACFISKGCAKPS